MGKQYLKAPLPFQGQKRMFAKEYIKVLESYPDGTTFENLFGGSGLLSHIAKCQKPNSTVVYNDFDNYRQRLEALPVTNAILEELRTIVDVPRHKPIFESHGIARKKLKNELQLFMQYERNVERYRDVGINRWDYCGSILVNSYPTYFEKLPKS